MRPRRCLQDVLLIRNGRVRLASSFPSAGSSALTVKRYPRPDEPNPTDPVRTMLMPRLAATSLPESSSSFDPQRAGRRVLRARARAR